MFSVMRIMDISDLKLVGVDYHMKLTKEQARLVTKIMGEITRLMEQESLPGKFSVVQENGEHTLMFESPDHMVTVQSDDTEGSE